MTKPSRIVGVLVALIATAGVARSQTAATTATVVYGQGGSLTTNIANSVASIASLSSPDGLAIDIAGGLYVADTENNRVLHFPAGSTTPDLVYGQEGNFASDTGGTGVGGLQFPQGIALDAAGGLYITDSGNNRVLHFPAGSTTADRVYGQNGNFTENSSDNGGISANSFNEPSGLAVDTAGGLYVADYFNSRVLHFPVGSTTADRVYGQGGSFTSGTGNNGGISTGSLATPTSVSLDGEGGLYVADSANYRVLHFPAGSTTADRVYAANNFGPPNSVAGDSAGGLFVGFGGAVLHFPTGSATADLEYGQSIGISASATGGIFYGLAPEVGGGIYISDSTNNRVLHFPSGSTMADRVYGQNGNFTTKTASSVSANSLSGPYGVIVDSVGGLYVSDLGNARVLHFQAGNTTADRVYGQGDDLTTAARDSGGVSPDSLVGPLGLALDGTGGLYVVDSGNNRVLHFPSGSTSADRVYGQAGSFTSNASNVGAVTATTLSGPTGVAVDRANGLYIAESQSNRVVHFSAGSITADRVYGQAGSFTSYLQNNGGASANTLNEPGGLAVDAAGGLYVADSGNSRVMHFSAGSTTADRIYGQSGSFTSTNPGLGGATVLRYPSGVTVDSTGGIYIGDSSDNRILHFPSGSTTPDRVYGQTNFTSAAGNSSGINTGLNSPVGVTVDTVGGLYVADSGNNRVLYFPPAPTFQTAQTITFAFAQSNVSFAVGVIALNATATSGLAVSFTGSTSGVCQVQVSIAVFLGVGTCTITASQPGNVDYSAATPVTVSFQVIQGSQTISFPQPPDVWIGAGTATLNATASSNLKMFFSSSTPAVCSVNNANVTLLATGSCTITAYEPGTANYLAAPSVTRTFQVTSGVVLTLNPAALSFRYTTGGTLPAAQSVTATANATQAFSIAVSTALGGNWLIAPQAASTTAPLSISLNAAVIQSLATGIYTGAVTLNGNNLQTVAIPVSLTVNSPVPMIDENGVVPVYSTATSVEPGEWISIFGSNFAAISATWDGDFPMKLGGVSVTIDGKPAYLSYAGSGQLNVQVPDDSTIGSVAVSVTTPNGTATSSVSLAPVGPTLSLLDTTHVAAIAINADGSYSIIGPSGAFPYSTRPVLPGETLVLYGSGFGPTNPPEPIGTPVTSPAQTANTVTVTIGGVPAQVVYSGIVSAGLWQINAIVPQLPAGDQSVQATVLKLSSPVGNTVTLGSR